MAFDLEPLLATIATARPDGHAVREWSLYVAQSRALTLGIKDREVGNAHAPLRLSESYGARYRLVWDDGKVSRGYVERRLLEQETERALRNARDAAHEDPDAAWVAGPTDFPEVELHDTDVARLAGGETAPFAGRLDAVRRLVDEQGFRTWSGSFSASESSSRVLSSSGLEGSSRSTDCGWHVTLNGEIGDGFGARDMESDGAFEQRLAGLARTAQLLGKEATPPAAGIRPVLLHPDVVLRYVISTLINNLNGSTVANGEGAFRKEQFAADAPVLREDIGLRIDPLQPLKSGAYRYTTEGIAAAPCVFVERGRLRQPILDMKYARRLGLPPTPLPSDSDTLHFDGASELSVDEALSRAGGGALVLSVLGVHTQDRASGDFSLSAPQALVIGPGGLEGKMRGTIAGNLFELLASDALRFVRFEGEPTPGLLLPCRLDPG